MATPLDTLRRRINALPRGMRRRYPDPLKRQIIDFVEQHFADDDKAARRCIRQLGLHWLTYNRWLAEGQRPGQSATPTPTPTPMTPSPAMLSVVVAAPAKASAMAPSTLTLCTPGGYRVAGFEHIEQLVELLARLEMEARP